MRARSCAYAADVAALDANPRVSVRRLHTLGTSSALLDVGAVDRPGQRHAFVRLRVDEEPAGVTRATDGDRSTSIEPAVDGARVHDVHRAGLRIPEIAERRFEVERSDDAIAPDVGNLQPDMVERSRIPYARIRSQEPEIHRELPRSAPAKR